MARVGRYKRSERMVWLVRCLGPADVAEHQFWSEDKIRDRVCSRCRERLREMNLSPRMANPVRANEDE